MRRYCRIRSFLLLAGLLAALPSGHARAVTISLVPDGPTTIEVGETVNVDVFMVLDAADQVAGVCCATMHLEYGGGLVTVAASGAGSAFAINTVNPVPPNPMNPLSDFIVFSQFGTTVNAAEAFLGSLTLTGAMEGSYDLVARRFSGFPLFTSPGVGARFSDFPLYFPPSGLGSYANRYDFASDETLRITVPCGDDACEAASPNPIEPEPPATPPNPDRLVSHHHQLNLHSSDVFYTLAGAPVDIETLTPTTRGSQVVPEPHTFALLGLALVGLMLLRSPRRESSKRSPGVWVPWKRKSSLR